MNTPNGSGATATADSASPSPPPRSSYANTVEFLVAENPRLLRVIAMHRWVIGALILGNLGLVAGNVMTSNNMTKVAKKPMGMLTISTVAQEARVFAPVVLSAESSDSDPNVAATHRDALGYWLPRIVRSLFGVEANETNVESFKYFVNPFVVSNSPAQTAISTYYRNQNVTDLALRQRRKIEVDPIGPPVRGNEYNVTFTAITLSLDGVIQSRSRYTIPVTIVWTDPEPDTDESGGVRIDRGNPIGLKLREIGIPNFSVLSNDAPSVIQRNNIPGMRITPGPRQMRGAATSLPRPNTP